MTGRELRKLSRRDLLELLIQLEQQNEELKTRVSKLEARLANRKIKIDNAGSMAEAALILNGVLESTDKAAEQYLENIKRCSEKQEEAYLEIVHAAEKKASEIILAAEKERNKRIEIATSYCGKVYRQLAELSREHPEIKDWLPKSRQENE